LINNGSAMPFSSVSTATTGQGPAALALGDLNGDGKLDAAVGNQFSSTITVHANSGGGMWNTAIVVNVPTLPLGLAIGDMNADGKADLVVGSYQNASVQIFTNSGTGMWNGGATATVGDRPRTIGLVDLNHDGLLDVTSVNEGSGGVSVVLGQPGAMFGQA